MIYETDTNRVLVWDNAAWVMIADTDQPNGLWRIDSKTLTGSAVDFTGCFTADYDIYKVFFYNVRASSNVTDFGMRLLVDTTPAITNYANERFSVQGATIGSAGSSLTYARVGYLGSQTTSPSNYETTIYNPFSVLYTSFVSVGVYNDDLNNAAYMENNNVLHKTATAYSGLRIYKDSGTFNGGTVVMFGVRT
jgi:hypothetical protein